MLFARQCPMSLERGVYTVMITRNLEALGLPPLPTLVRASVTRWHVEHDLGERDPLSLLGRPCPARRAVWAEYPDSGYRIRVTGPGGFEGTISSDGHLDRKGVPLGAAYLTRVATDRGATHELDAARLLPRAADFVGWARGYVRAWYGNPGQEDSTAASFLHTLMDFYAWDSESMFGDGNCAACGPLWRAACWDVFGEERPYPYRFVY